jgi:hypothetical protein
MATDARPGGKITVFTNFESSMGSEISCVGTAFSRETLRLANLAKFFMFGRARDSFIWEPTR